MEQLVELEREMHQEKVELLQELSKTEASFVAAEVGGVAFPCNREDKMRFAWIFCDTCRDLTLGL